MIHERQRLPLSLEACNNALRIHAELDDLKRDTPAYRLLLLGHVNDTATTFAQLLKEFVPPNPVARFLRQQRRLANEGGASQKVRVALVIFSFEQGKNLVLQLRIATTHLGKKSLALGADGLRLRLVEQFN